MTSQKIVYMQLTFITAKSDSKTHILVIVVLGVDTYTVFSYKFFNWRLGSACFSRSTSQVGYGVSLELFMKTPCTYAYLFNATAGGCCGHKQVSDSSLFCLYSFSLFSLSICTFLIVRKAVSVCIAICSVQLYLSGRERCVECYFCMLNMRAGGDQFFLLRGKNTYSYPVFIQNSENSSLQRKFQESQGKTLR